MMDESMKSYLYDGEDSVPDNNSTENKTQTINRFSGKTNRGKLLREAPKYPLPDRFQVLSRMQNTR